MDVSEVEENLFAASDAKLHGEMCKTLSNIYCKVMSIFPSLEDARPRSKSGIQALCSLHIALEKAKNILQHCSESSKLYLAITGDSVVLKFERAKSALIDSLRRVEDIVPQSIGCQVLEIVTELDNTVFSLDPLEKEAGDRVIALLQQGKEFDNSNDNNTELEAFHLAATTLGITSSRSALAERRILRKLVEKARIEEDKRKESIVAYLLHLMRKYAKLFRTEVTEENDSQSSGPCSPLVHSYSDEGNDHVFGRQVTKIMSFNFKPSNRRLEQNPVPPEELRCPISLQLMYDPVIISSGQTYERICIEKWFSDGHNTCPKTQQQLPHLCLTPNYSVKGLIATWCEQNGVPVPSSPPESLDLNYYRLVLSETESDNSKTIDDSIGSCKIESVTAVPFEESGTIEEEDKQQEYMSTKQESSDIDLLERYQEFLTCLDGDDMERGCNAVEKIRLLLKDDDEARIFMGANGFVGGLLRFLESAVRENNAMAQEMGAMALFNLAVNNNRNKELMLASGVIPLLEEMISNSQSHESATALYLNLSCLQEAKPIIGVSKAVPFLIERLQVNPLSQCKLDALHALYNLSTVPSNISNLLDCGIVTALESLAISDNNLWTDKSLAVLLNLTLNQSGKEKMVAAPTLIGSLATLLDTGERLQQEQAVSCLFRLCSGNEKCSEMVLQEGVVPSLVSISVNGTVRGRDKAQKLLMLFREQRQREQVQRIHLFSPNANGDTDGNTMQETTDTGLESQQQSLNKSISTRKIGRAFSHLWKSKSYSVYHW